MVREIRPGHSLHVHWRDYPRLEEVTMELTDAIKARHSVRTYLDKPIEMAKNHSITSSGNPRHRLAQCRQRAL